MKPVPPQSPATRVRASRPIDTAAAEWIVRRRAGLDAAGEAEFVVWQADLAHAEALGRMSAMSEAVQRARATGASGAIVTQLKIFDRRQRVRRRVCTAAGLAAAMVLGASYWWSLPRAAFPPAPSSVVHTAERLRRLPDGSIVELNVDARIAVRFEPTRRLVELEQGEALFRVEKDAARPFLVRVAGVEVRAVGTAFCVKLAGAAVEVFVTEGQVGVEDAARGRTLLPLPPDQGLPVLVAGQRVTIEPSRASDAPYSVRVAAVGPVEMKEGLAWRIPRLEFDGAELAQAVEQLNQLNRLQISLEGAGIGHMRISGTFFPDDPRTFARLAATSLGLRLEDEGGNKILLRQISAERKP